MDQAKLSSALGTRFAVPVEVTPFGWACQGDFLTSIGARWTRRARTDGSPFLTDQGNFILDCHFGSIADVIALGRQLDARAGIVEHGLFLGLVSEVISAGPDGLRRLTAISR